LGGLNYVVFEIENIVLQ